MGKSVKSVIVYALFVLSFGLFQAPSLADSSLTLSQFRTLVWHNFVDAMGEYKTRTFFKNFTEEDWLHLFQKTEVYFDQILVQKWSFDLQEKEQPYRIALKSALVESWVWVELRSQKNLFCPNCLNLDDTVLMQLNKSSNPRPDGIFYQIKEGKLVIRFLFEAKSGSRRANYPQAEKFLNHLKKHGLYLPEGYFRDAYVLNRFDEMVPLEYSDPNNFFDSYFVWVRDRLSSGFQGIDTAVSFKEYVPDAELTRISGFIMNRIRLLGTLQHPDFPGTLKRKCDTLPEVLLTLWRSRLALKFAQ